MFLMLQTLVVLHRHTQTKSLSFSSGIRLRVEVIRYDGRKMTGGGWGSAIRKLKGGADTSRHEQTAVAVDEWKKHWGFIYNGKEISYQETEAVVQTSLMSSILW